MIKNVVIIGGSKGIGLSMSKKFLQEKNIVHIISRNRAKNLEEGLEGKVFFYNCDASKIDELSLVRKKILKKVINLNAKILYYLRKIQFS